MKKEQHPLHPLYNHQFSWRVCALLFTTTLKANGSIIYVTKNYNISVMASWLGFVKGSYGLE